MRSIKHPTRNLDKTNKIPKTNTQPLEKPMEPNKAQQKELDKTKCMQQKTEHNFDETGEIK